MSFDPDAIGAFRYLGFDVDPDVGTLTCRYALDDAVEFVEVVRGEPGDAWRSSAALEAARLVFLLAGVSYYKAGAPKVIDLGDTVMRPRERDFLRDFYLDGLGEFAFRNGLDLSGLQIVGGRDREAAPAPWPAAADRPLIPFGGGIDSIVTVEAVRSAQPDAALFVLSRHGVHFDAIEEAAAVAALPVLRADQNLDPKIRRSTELGYRNGHVPVTGVLSSIAALVAALHGRDSVVMSNEWSASIGNTTAHGRAVNHQWSKSLAFEEAFRRVLADAFGPAPDYFSFLRDRSELWVAQQFAGLAGYHRAFRSCNRAFHVDPGQRLDRWCGRCDKCAFIDLILAPFLDRQELAVIFGGREPLDVDELEPTFRTLVGLSGDVKPFECVGDVDECRVAAVLAAERDDRRDQGLIQGLVAELGEVAGHARKSAPRLFEPLGSSFVPHAFAS